MGNLESGFKLDAGMTASFPDDVFIVANATDVARLRATPAEARIGNAELLALSPDAALPVDLVARARVLVLEVDPSDPASLGRLSRVRAERTDLPIIAAIHDASISLVRTLIRQGIADIAVLPFDADELVTQILDATASSTEKKTQSAIAPMATVVRSCGGCGATTVITHLAAALARQIDGSQRVCVVDLDLQSGEVAPFVGLSPKVTVMDLLDAGERLDSEFLRSAVTESSYGFSVIAAPEAITPLETIDVDQLLRLLTLLRTEFDFVLVDLPADWTNWALSVALASSEVMLVTDLSIASLRQAKRRSDLFSSVGVDRKKVGVVVNRAQRRLFKTIGVDEVGEVLKRDVLTTLATEGAALSSAQDEGLLITEVSPRSKFAADIRTLAQLLAGRSE